MDYNRTAATASRLLAAFGQSVTLKQLAGGGSAAYDPNTGVVATGTPVTSTRKGLVTDNPGQRIGASYGQHYQNGTLVEQDDKWMYLDVKGAAPRTQDKIVLSTGEEFYILDVQPLAPGGIVLLYLIVIRT